MRTTLDSPSGETALFRIGQLARATGISRATIMRFEEDGLLTPSHVNEESGYRYYDVNNLAQLCTILTLQQLGFTKKEIRDMDSPAKAIEQVRRLQHQHMILLRELEDLTASKDNPDSIHVRIGRTLGGNFFFRKREMLYTPENVRTLVADTMEDFMKANITASTQQTIKVFIEGSGDDFYLKDNDMAIGQFDGKKHLCTVVVPVLDNITGPDFISLNPRMTATLACKCDYHDS